MHVAWHTYMEKAHAATSDAFCNMHRHLMKHFYSFVHRRPKKWISIGNRITGLFPCGIILCLNKAIFFYFFSSTALLSYGFVMKNRGGWIELKES